MRFSRFSHSYFLRPFLFMQKNMSTIVPSNKFQMDSSMHTLKFFIIKTVVFFSAIYLFIILPLSSSVEMAFRGLDHALAKPSSKLMLISLISNPEVLYQIANEELRKGNLEKANNFTLVALGIIEIHQTDPAYKAKFYELEKRISAARKANTQ